MKAFVKKSVIMAAAVSVMFVGLSFSGEDVAPGHLGVRLMPVPAMLAVHLGLDEGVGQMVMNVVVGSAADKAGLVQYDVITAVGGERVDEYEVLVGKIKSAGAGVKLKLTVVSRGKRRNIGVKLGKEPQDELEWKYPRTPIDVPHPLRAGPGRRPEPRTFRKDRRSGPLEGDEWPFALPEEFRHLFRREHRFRYDPPSGVPRTDEGETIILPDEELEAKLQKLEKRLEALEQQQARILEELDQLLEEK